MKLIILSLISLVNSVNAFNQIDVGLVSKLYKVRRVFPMVIWSEFCLKQYRDDDHLNDARHFRNDRNIGQQTSNGPWSLTNHGNIIQVKREMHRCKSKVHLCDQFCAKEQYDAHNCDKCRSKSQKSSGY